MAVALDARHIARDFRTARRRCRDLARLGALIGDMPLILANAVTLVLAGTILFFKIKNG